MNSAPLLPAAPPARSQACSAVSQVSTPNGIATSLLTASSASARAPARARHVAQCQPSEGERSDRAMNEPVDPRLVALGLVPPPATEQRPREQHPTPPPPAAPRSAPAPRGATQKRVPGPLDRFLPPSYWEAAASAEAPPPERTAAAPSRQSGPLDAFLPRSQAVAAPPPAPPARPVPPPFVAAAPPPATSPWPQRDVAPPAPSVSPQVVPSPAAPPASPSAPPSAPLLAPRGEPIR